jgi:hypothetical protein
LSAKNREIALVNPALIINPRNTMNNLKSPAKTPDIKKYDTIANGAIRSIFKHISKKSNIL